MRSRTRKTIISVLIVVVTATTVLIIRSYLLSRLRDAVSETLDAIDRTGLTVRYDTIDVSWRTNTITIGHLVLSKDPYDTGCVYPEFLSARQVQVKGLNILALLLSEARITEVVVHAPHITLRKNSTWIQNDSSKGPAPFSIDIDRVRLTSAHIEYIDSTSCKPKTELNTHVLATGLTVNVNADQPFRFTMASIEFDSTRLRLAEQAYTLHIQKAGVNFTKGSVYLDTVVIVPHHSKLQFGRIAGHDIDRIEGVIPFIRLSGMTCQYQDTVALHAAKIDLQLFLKIFHDKRLPHKNNHKPLPHRFLRTLPFGLAIDSLTLVKSYVEYEEFAPGAEAAGTVYFDNLQASIKSISNDPHLKDGQTELQAAADFMGQGKLEMQTIFPWDTKKNCVLKGSLKNFPLVKINTMLQPAANLAVESGKMNRLTFRFAYNETRSDGEIELDYNDLKLIILKSGEAENRQRGDKKNRGQARDEQEPKKDNLKTFIINTFIVRKNMDQTVPEEKRTGTVLFYRNKTRSIFNYWWKSLFSGIQSSFDINTAVSGKGKKATRSK